MLGGSSAVLLQECQLTYISGLHNQYDACLVQFTREHVVRNGLSDKDFKQRL